MDYTNAALTYGLLLFPAFFAFVVLGQGIMKMRKGDPSGKIIALLGFIFFLLIPLTYFFLIRI